jgi:hypothetical protein
MPLLSCIDHPLGNGQPFRHPSTKRACRYTGLRLCRKVKTEDIGEFSSLKALCYGAQIGIKFNVMGGKFPNLASTHTNHAIVRMEPFPSPRIQGQLEG